MEPQDPAPLAPAPPPTGDADPQSSVTPEPKTPETAGLVGSVASDPGTPATGVGIAAGSVAVDAEEERRRRRRLAFLLFLLLLFVTLLTLLSVWYLIYRRPITDLLPPISQNEPPHYLFSMYDAAAPVSVAVSTSGDRVYVAQTSGDRLVAVYDSGGKELGDLQPPSDSLPHIPVYVAVDPRDGDVYVSDRATGAVYVYSSQGSFLRSFQPKVAIPGWQPLGMALSPAGNWWITDLSGPYHRVEVFAQDGTLIQVIGSPGQFDFPNMIAFDPSGNAYVTDSNNGRLVVLAASGQQLATIGRGSAPGNLGLPRGVATDDTGRLYVVDATGQFVHLYRIGTTSDWRPTLIDEFGASGVGDGQFQYPNGIATDSRHRVYVTDRDNNRVQVWGY